MNIYLFGSDNFPSSNYFDGYCFYENNYINSSDNAEDVIFAKKSIPPHLDGCYVSIIKKRDELVIGCDFNGFKKLFYYYIDDFWCVSNSLLTLAEYVVEKRKKLSINRGQMQALGLDLNFTTCLSSFNTVFEEINLMPSYSYIHIKNNKFNVLNQVDSEKFSYQSGLSHFLSLWVERFSCLLANDKIILSPHLTAGKDSRAVISILKMALDTSNFSGNNIGIISGESEANKIDREIAKKIASQYGLNLAESTGQIRLSGEDSYRNWKYFSLGIYNPIYFPNFTYPSNVIQFSGIGGENMRNFYQFNDIDSMRSLFIRSTKNNIDCYLDQVQLTLEKLKDDLPDVPPFVSHYREFRSRIHGGRTPEQAVCFAPIASGVLAKTKISNEKINNAQVNFDIMQNCVPGLAFEEYDKIEKSPTQFNVDNFSKVNINSCSNDGSCYFYSQSNEIKRRKQVSFDRFEAISNDFELAISNRDICEFIPSEVFKSAIETMAISGKNRKFKHAFDAKNISRIITANFALSLASS